MEHKICLPDYKNCIANLPNSILKKFGVETVGETLPLLDKYLDKNYKNIVVLLLDGMGINIIENNLDKDGFFRSHFVGEYSSVFPPTTVAATTSIMSGLMPNEHCWLGWDCYYPKEDKNVTVFLNLIQGTKEQAADYFIPFKYTPYEPVVDRLNRNGKHAYTASPFEEPFPSEFEEICNRIEELCKSDEEKYIYAYWEQPDGIMHKEGCYCQKSKDVLRSLERRVEALCENLEDTLLIITADHGHMDSDGECILDYPTITECLKCDFSIEPRALNFYVKEGKEEQFENEFNKFFGEKFLLYTREQVIEKQLFGTGTNHTEFSGMVGDYLAIAISDLSIYNTYKEKAEFIGVHAGLTEEEMRIPLIVVELEK